MTKTDRETELEISLKRAIVALNRVPSFPTAEGINSYALIAQLEDVSRNGAIPMIYPIDYNPSRLTIRRFLLCLAGALAFDTLLYFAIVFLWALFPDPKYW